MTGPVPGAALELVVHPDEGTLVVLTAGRLLAALLDAQAARGTVHLVVTGGGVGTALLQAVGDHPARDALDWHQVQVWWGDERFVAADDADRNDRGARAALFDRVPARLHAMAALAGEPGGSTQQGAVEPSDRSSTPSAGGPPTAPDLDAAAAAYTVALRSAAGGAVPAFDVLLLGVGPEGHCGSLFPHSAGVRERSAPVVGVADSPKPPPARVTLTLPAMQRARQVWVLASGPEKAETVARALAGATPDDLPVAGARGTERTLWLVDRAAAGG